MTMPAWTTSVSSPRSCGSIRSGADPAAGSGHPTSSMSAADLMAVLLTRHLRYDWQRPDDPANDHLIFSKGTRRRCCTRCSRRASSPTRS
jgi:Transketolase, thiamine diphosphate binding domain